MVRLRRIIRLEVIENFHFDLRGELPEILRLLHPADDIEPGLAIRALTRDQCVGVTSSAMRAHLQPAGRYFQSRWSIDVIGECRDGR